VTGDPEGDDRVDLPGAATACNGLRDDDPGRAVSDQIHLPLDGEPVGELLYRGSERYVGDRVDDHASGA